MNLLVFAGFYAAYTDAWRKGRVQPRRDGAGWGGAAVGGAVGERPPEFDGVDWKQESDQTSHRIRTVGGGGKLPPPLGGSSFLDEEGVMSLRKTHTSRDGEGADEEEGLTRNGSSFVLFADEEGVMDSLLTHNDVSGDDERFLRNGGSSLMRISVSAAAEISRSE